MVVNVSIFSHVKAYGNNSDLSSTLYMRYCESVGLLQTK
jgi:hypothetical protein